MKNLFPLLVALLLTLALWACVTTDPIEDLPPCPHGKPFFIDVELLNHLSPITSKAIAIFKDSVNTEMAFKPESTGTYKGKNFDYDCAAHCNGGKCSNLVLTPDVILRSVKDSTLSLYIFTQMDRKEEFKNTICGIESLGIHLLHGKRKKELMLVPVVAGCGINTTQKAATYSIRGVEYSNVLADQRNAIPNAYMDKKVGVLAFRDFDNRLWIFDRYE
jgi:hypothetical protein